ncbi:CPBP family intramembrane glutamic endopeptidase [Cohnella mopanensis]|uniref:CPBP family intramembrane glutamic endopeptidase n=1 Tax=Cohnella mopanensis TaxID=2911966 RepID=UPI001EF81F4A|nr:CPBP family intramembrane glutamic endopeptidase [Cohnella mopanensis]
MIPVSKRNLVLFGLIVLVSGWIGIVVDRVLKDQPEGNTLGMGLWLVMPLLTVLVLRSFAGDGWKDTGFQPRFKGNLMWYLVALIVFPLITAVVLLAGALLGWIDLSNLQASPSLMGVVMGLLLGQFVKNIFEEAVWRGYLTSKLVQLKMKDWHIYAIAGIIWGSWHIPYYLFFLPTSDMYSVLPVDKLTFAVVAIANMIGWSVMFVELFRVTGSIWPCILMHSVEDSLINPLVIDGYIAISSGKEWLVSPIAGILTTLLYVGVGLAIRAVRYKRDSYNRNSS